MNQLVVHLRVNPGIRLADEATMRNACVKKTP
jgi:hypothetical protein